MIHLSSIYLYLTRCMHMTTVKTISHTFSEPKRVCYMECMNGLKKNSCQHQINHTPPLQKSNGLPLRACHSPLAGKCTDGFIIDSTMISAKLINVAIDAACFSVRGKPYVFVPKWNDSTSLKNLCHSSLSPCN